MSTLTGKFGAAPREGERRLVDHYPELQAPCDALGHAAQQELAEAIERGNDVARERT